MPGLRGQGAFCDLYWPTTAASFQSWCEGSHQLGEGKRAVGEKSETSVYRAPNRRLYPLVVALELRG